MTKRDYSMELHEVIMEIYTVFDKMTKIVADLRKELKDTAEEERKKNIMETFDKIMERKNDQQPAGEVTHHAV